MGKKKENRGGAREGAGRPKGSGVKGRIAGIVRLIPEAWATVRRLAGAQLSQSDVQELLIMQAEIKKMQHEDCVALKKRLDRLIERERKKNGQTRN